jgi:lysophospholipase L1-like esterase
MSPGVRFLPAALLLSLVAMTGCARITQANANIAFMGDSITNSWWLPKTNFGVPGDTTSQMLARFPGQVIGHGYKAVVILGGTNDIRTVHLPIGPATATAISKIQAMAALAEADGQQVILCLIPPIQNEADYSRVVYFNQAIAALAAEHNYKLVDYYTPMAGHPDYFSDQLHPNDAGYFVMQTALTGVLPLDY